MATPTTSEQVTQIGPSSQTHIDALLFGSKWGGPVGTGLTLTYSFPTYGSSWSTAAIGSGGYGASTGSGEPWANRLSPLSAVQQSAFSQALQAWSAVANISFAQVADTSSMVGDIRVAFSTAVSSSTSAHAYYPYHPEGAGGDVWINPNTTSTTSFQPTSFGFYVMVHEIGHALGLKHPFDDSPTLPASTDNARYTVMSYDDAPSTTIFPSTPMLYDIAAIQYLYGANTSYRTGNDLYQFSASSEELRTIWDAGGTDTLDASNQILSATLNLNAGTFSSIGVRNNGGAATSNVGIAYGATIENARGGTASDLILGNTGGNVLDGNSGNDTLYAGSGRDELYGGGNDDRLFGNRGEDTLFGGGDQDILFGGVDNDLLFGGDGDDRLQADDGVDLLFGNRGSDMLFGNLGNDTLYGGSDDDLLYSGRDSDLVYGDAGNDTLSGDQGNDTLYGGDGADIFRFHIGDGNDTVMDFTFSAGDRLETSSSRGYALTSSGTGEAIIDFLNGDKITLSGISAGQVTSSWFVFV
ncbi:MAG TPA: M10 family metallopeptidase [Azospirillum sp.]|nr:M10 family metallopeptidase [Azospirillum sp.]